MELGRILLLALSVALTARGTKTFTDHGARQRIAPHFSWDTVPVFAETSNVSGFFDVEAMQTLSRFSLFVVEKAYAFESPGFEEDKISALAARLRQLNPKMELVFYYNANLDLPGYRLYNTTTQVGPYGKNA